MASRQKLFGPFFQKRTTSFLAFLFGALACQTYRWGWYANTALAVLLGVLACARRPEMVVIEAPAPPRAPVDMQATLDQVPAPLLAQGADGVLVAGNRAARLLFGTDDVVRAPSAELLAGIQAAAAGERVVVKLSARSVAVSVAESFTPHGRRLLAVLTDVQAEIQAAEAAALRDLLAVLGHEIMNALTPVMSLAESAHALLGQDEAAASQAREALEIILRRAEGLERFVQGYRQLARVPDPVLQPASADTVLREAAALFAARWGRRGVRLHVAAPSPDVIARMDAGLIGQALLNLLANAAEAALAHAPGPQVWLDAWATPRGLAFGVRDNGPGVAAAMASAIFQPFFSAKEGGSGIGLTLARQIAQIHGGSLGLEEGAFILRL